jgi:EAL domain-containing protein (putative c-di-GMP-specific phosphodiesterase class I)/DNA-binding NarL/FixJ family response regulator
MKLTNINLKNITILYCEDEEDLRNITYDILSQYTKKVLVAQDGQKGLEIYKDYAEKIDLIITDINMPIMNGLDMIREIKKLNENIAIIVATAFSSSSYLLDAIELGIDKYILKPINIIKLFDTISKALIYHELQDLYIDNLTHLANRNSLIRDLDKSNNNSMALFDIDGFTTLNELYGDKIGDDILIQLSYILEDNFNIIEHKLYRVGDDKFALVSYSDSISLSTLEDISNIFLNKHEQDGITIEQEAIHFGITVAISQSNSSKTYSDALRTLRYQKDNYISLMKYDDKLHAIDINYKDNHLWIQRLKKGLKNGEFQAFYQGIIDVKTQEVYKYEALVRYITKDGEVIPPYKFLPIAKKAKLLSSILKLMLNECIKFIKVKKTIVSVNISFEDIKSKDTYTYIMKILKQNENITAYLHFELLETEEISDFTLAKKFVADVKKFACQVGVDDFGAGYSNFNMLSELDVDFVKIDGSLIKEVDTNENQEIIVDTIVSYAKRTNIKTIAEFVSNKEIFEKIKSLDTNYAQGYYFCEPLAFKNIKGISKN